MTRMRTRIIASAVVFAANMALSLSYGTAEAQLPHRSATEMSCQHHPSCPDPTAIADEIAPVTLMPETPTRPPEYPGFVGSAC